MDGYVDGYFDHTAGIPAGVTTYTGINNLGGLKSAANWGAGDINAQKLVDEKVFKHSVLVIGLWMADGHEERVAAGGFDENIVVLADWMKAQERPIFLRIGYEFDGPWNTHEPEAYVTAYQRIVDTLAELDVQNVATVWQSATWGETYNDYEWELWYPGDDYVDWFGMSYFTAKQDVLNSFIDLAREHNKPLMIAEATPYGFNVKTMNPDTLWNSWYGGFFDFIYENRDIIQAVAYINVD
jgi:hypothetical protein